MNSDQLENSSNRKINVENDKELNNGFCNQTDSKEDIDNISSKIEKLNLTIHQEISILNIIQTLKDEIAIAKQENQELRENNKINIQLLEETKKTKEALNFLAQDRQKTIDLYKASLETQKKYTDKIALEYLDLKKKMAKVESKAKEAFCTNLILKNQILEMKKNSDLNNLACNLEEFPKFE